MLDCSGSAVAVVLDLILVVIQIAVLDLEEQVQRIIPLHMLVLEQVAQILKVLVLMQFNSLVLVAVVELEPLVQLFKEQVDLVLLWSLIQHKELCHT